MIIHSCEQNSDAWLKLRSGLPTASCFSKLIQSNGSPSKSMKKYAQDLAGECFAGHPLDGWEGNKYTDQGLAVEEEARLYFSMLTGKETQQVGFITDDLEQYGCSPDSLVEDDEGLEIKCLPRLHIEKILYCKKNGRIPTDFVQQVQGSLFITGRKVWNLLFYHADLPKVIMRITPDEKVITGLKAQLTACLAERNLVLKELKSF